MEPQTRNFKQGAATALKDEKIQRNLKGLYSGFHQARISAAEATPNWEEMREQGRVIKAHTLENLDYYLELVEANVTRAGGKVYFATDAEAANKAISMIEDLTREVKVGDIYTGKVVRLMNFGAFVQILPGRDGLVHISELANYHVPSVEDVVDIGEEVTVVVKEIDSMGRINLSRRALLEDSDGDGSEGGDPPGVDRPLRAGNGGQRFGDRRPDGPRPPPRGGDRGGFRPQGSRPGGRRGGRPGGNRPPPRRDPR